MNHAIADEKRIRAGGLGNLSAPVEHQGVIEAMILGILLGQSGDHVQAGGLGMNWSGIRRRPPPRRNRQPNTARGERRVEIFSPCPGSDRQMRLGPGWRHPHPLRPAPCDRAHVGILHSACSEHFDAGGVDFLDRPGQLETEQLGAVAQPRAMVAELEDGAVIGALAFENRARVVQRVGQHMDVGVAPRHHLAIKPDEPIAIVKIRLLGHSSPFSRRRPTRPAGGANQSAPPLPVPGPAAMLPRAFG